MLLSPRDRSRGVSRVFSSRVGGADVRGRAHDRRRGCQGVSSAGRGRAPRPPAAGAARGRSRTAFSFYRRDPSLIARDVTENNGHNANYK